jgi:plastocyanin
VINPRANILRRYASPDLALVAAMPILLVAAACGGTSGNVSHYSASPEIGNGAPVTMTGMTMAASADAPPDAAVASNQVSIQNFSFGPGTVTVSPGVTVTWTNDDSVTHTVTAADGSFDSSSLAPGQGFSYTFTTPGTYAYHCSIHPFMTGEVVVR